MFAVAQAGSEHRSGLEALEDDEGSADIKLARRWLKARRAGDLEACESLLLRRVGEAATFWAG